MSWKFCFATLNISCSESEGVNKSGATFTPFWFISLVSIVISCGFFVLFPIVAQTKTHKRVLVSVFACVFVDVCVTQLGDLIFPYASESNTTGDDAITLH